MVRLSRRVRQGGGRRRVLPRQGEAYNMFYIYIYYIIYIILYIWMKHYIHRTCVFRPLKMRDKPRLSAPRLLYYIIIIIIIIIIVNNCNTITLY